MRLEAVLCYDVLPGTLRLRQPSLAIGASVCCVHGLGLPLPAQGISPVRVLESVFTEVLAWTRPASKCLHIVHQPLKVAVQLSCWSCI